MPNRGPWIQTAPSNSKFHLANPDAAEIKVVDVAYHLAGIFRYTGGSRITVAQHSVNGARMARRHYPTATLLPARMLVHDSHESFYGDASSPLKSLLPDYRYLERDIAEPVFEERFDILWAGDPQVKEVDRRLMLTERPQVFSEVLPFDDEWSMAEGLFPFADLDITPWSPDQAEQEWLEEFRQLLPWVEW